MKVRHIAAALAVGFLALPSAALADDCKAIPDKGPLPSYLRQGATFSGPVVYVGDGDGLCVDVGGRGRRDEWVEVRLADFYAPELSQPGGREAKAALERVAKGQVVSCRAERRTYDRIAAVCTLRGRPIGDLMRAAGVREGGNGR